MKKRVISLLLAVMLLAGVMSVSAFAAGDVEISVKSYEDNGEFYPGDEFTVPVKIGPDGYAGAQFSIKTSSNVEVTGIIIESGYREASDDYSEVLWLNGVADEDGDIDVTNGLVNVNKADLEDGIIIEYWCVIADDAAEGDEFEIEITVSAASAEEQWIVKDAVASTSGTISERPYTLGDVVEDGSFDILDVQKACMVFLGVETFECAPEAADVVVDGTFDIMDVQKFCMVFLGVESF